MSDSPLNLPEISPEYCERAEVRLVTADAALQLCGIHESGLLIPYRNFYGERIEDGESYFCRLRLDHPRGGQKYHQPSGSAPHAYLPPNIWEEDKTLKNPIVIVEGEKKALALAEAGYTAIGIGGFYNFRESGGILVEEIEHVRSYVSDPGFVFLGDNDVARADGLAKWPPRRCVVSFKAARSCRSFFSNWSARMSLIKSPLACSYNCNTRARGK